MQDNAVIFDENMQQFLSSPICHSNDAVIIASFLFFFFLDVFFPYNYHLIYLPLPINIRHSLPNGNCVWIFYEQICMFSSIAQHNTHLLRPIHLRLWRLPHVSFAFFFCTSHRNACILLRILSFRAAIFSPLCCLFSLCI